MRGILPVILGLYALFNPGLTSDDPQPTGEDRVLSEIAKTVEAKGYLVSEIDFETAHWDVEAYKDRTEWELTVSKAGEITSEQED